VGLIPISRSDTSQELRTFLQRQKLPAISPQKPILDAHGHLVLCCQHIVIVSLISFV
jgi:hypothetical protein